MRERWRGAKMERGREESPRSGAETKRREKDGIPAADRSLSARTTRTITKAKPHNDIKAVCLASCNGSIENMENISKWEGTSGLSHCCRGQPTTYVYSAACWRNISKDICRRAAMVTQWCGIPLTVVTVIIVYPRFINSEKYPEARCYVRHTHTQSNDTINDLI